MLQRQLAVATANARYVATDVRKSSAVQFVIQRKGHSAGYYAATSRELRNRLSSANAHNKAQQGASCR